MAKEKIMPFVEARAKLCEIVDRVAEHESICDDEPFQFVNWEKIKPFGFEQKT